MKFLSSTDVNTLGNIGDIVVCILSIIFLWKIFEKAGEKGWKAIIPFYSTYVLFKLVWETKYFWIFYGFIFFMFLGISVMAINPSNLALSGTGDFIFIGSFVVFLIIYIKLLSKICSSFNKSRLFMVGLLFLNVIFLGILAFDKSEYIGPRGN